MKYGPENALRLLRLATAAPDAVFRPDQEKAIHHIVEGMGRLLVVQKTGWGKSFVYFIACKLLREQGHGPALLISPLLALMRNQISAAERMGVRAAKLTSDNQIEWGDVEARLSKNEVDILLISPERLANEHFRNEVLSKIAARISMLVVDEAHCISDWGHDFRPHYRLIQRIVQNFPDNFRLLGTTATANNRVMDDLCEVLGPKLTVLRGDLNRPSLLLQSIRLPSKAQRLAWLAERLPNLPGHGIIYTLTVRDTEEVAEWLRSCGMNVEAYSGETGESRPELEQALLENRIKALVATTALGMGFDKPDLSFVIHYQAPGSVVAYYQQVGRAGRAIDTAYGVMLSGEEETEISDYFINSAFPSREDVMKVLKTLLSAHEGISINEIMHLINLSKGRIQKVLDLLSLESPAPIVKQGAKWQLTTTTLNDTLWKRAERLTTLRRQEQAQMQEYVKLKSGHMDFLIRALDGTPDGIQSPAIEPLTERVERESIQRAQDYLLHGSLTIEPRKMWIYGGMPRYMVKGKIDPSLQAQPGRSLSRWGDAGWYELVRKGKYQDRHYSDELVQACAKMIREWNPQPYPTWVSCIPSLRHENLVPDFAMRLAAALNLPFHPVLAKVQESREQKEMENSVQQALNVDGTLSFHGRLPRRGPVFMVDDMLDSGWTMTVAAWLLRSNGGGEVWPVSLALTGTK